jgi:diguanylate cyclase (GGDEF)-like protein/PAS domain S-box-containing protein
LRRPGLPPSLPSSPGEYTGEVGWLSSVLEASSDAVHIQNRDGIILSWNQSAERLYGYAPGDALGRRGTELFPRALREEAGDLVERALLGERVEQFEIEVQRQDGMVVPVWLTLSPVRNARGHISGVAILARDVTEQKLAQATLAESEATLQEAQALAHVGIFAWDVTAGTLQWSEELYRIHDVDPLDFDGTVESYSTLVAPEDQEAVAKRTRDAVLHNRMLEMEYQIVRPGGERRWVYLRAEPVDTAVLGTVGMRGICQDITERKLAEAALSHQALHDPLTNLPNRTLFLDRLGHALLRLEREEGLLAVLFLDLDGFKMINDSLGHEAGDELLVVMALRLREGLRPGDTVARFGGDEFTVLCEDLESQDEALVIARRVAELVAQPIMLRGEHDVVLTTSVGITFSGGEGTPEGLLRDADAAMYRAKEEGPARCSIFDAALHARATARLGMIRELRRATDLGQLRLHYQPQVTLPEGRIVGVEGLVRWQHPERGLLGPAEFIPLAEESQLVLSIGEWVIDEACRQAAGWQSEFDTPVKVSVNVSARQLKYGDLADSIKRALARTGLQPAALCLEITENVIMGDADFFLEALLGLRFLGVSLAVDDFGTGYSSLGYLKRFPIDVLKVDKAFVDGLGHGDRRARAIPRAVVAMARDLGMTTVAEGVETLDQANELAALKCDQAQGYYFARPQPPETVTELLRRRSLP